MFHFKGTPLKILKRDINHIYLPSFSTSYQKHERYAENRACVTQSAAISRRCRISKMTRRRGAEKRSRLGVGACLRREERRLTGRVNHPPVCGDRLRNKVGMWRRCQRLMLPRVSDFKCKNHPRKPLSCFNTCGLTLQYSVCVSRYSFIYYLDRWFSMLVSGVRLLRFIDILQHNMRYAFLYLTLIVWMSHTVS